MFGPKREEVMGGWKKFHNFYYLANTISGIISVRMGWVVGYVVCMGEMCTQFLYGYLKGSDHVGDIGIDESII
jgi:hypothetical protein